MKTETFTDKTAFLATLHAHAKRKTHRIPSVRPVASGEATDVSAVERSERTGLTSLLKVGWCNEYDKDMNMRLYRGDISTGYYADERQVCQAARLLAEEGE